LKTRVKPVGFVFIALLISSAMALGYGQNVPGKLGNTVPTLTKLIVLTMGAFFSWRAVRMFERGSTVRLGWTGMALWLSSWALGQCVYTYYLLALAQHAPTPSLADPPFILGCFFGIFALGAFVIAWRRSGIVQTSHDLIWVGVVTGAGVVCALVVFPTALCFRPSQQARQPSIARQLCCSIPCWTLC